MKIAIIDDDPIYQFITRKMFERTAPEYELLVFQDGQEAIDFIRHGLAIDQPLPGLILLDINMPNLNGWQFLDALRNLDATEYQPSIYLVSSSSNQADVLKSRTYTELKGYLRKPLTWEQVADLFK